MEKVIGNIRLEAEEFELKNQPEKVAVKLGTVISLLEANFEDEDMFYVVGIKNSHVENIMRGHQVDRRLFGGVLLNESDSVLLIHNARSTGGNLSKLLREENKLKQAFLEMASVLEINVVDYLLLYKFRNIAFD